MEFARNYLDLNTVSINIIDPMLIFLKKEPRNLIAALKFYCNENLEDAHSAEADTIAAKKILLAQIEKYAEYRTKRVILEIFDEMLECEKQGKQYATRLDPPPADPRVAHKES